MRKVVRLKFLQAVQDIVEVESQLSHVPTYFFAPVLDMTGFGQSANGIQRIFGCIALFSVSRINHYGYPGAFCQERAAFSHLGSDKCRKYRNSCSRDAHKSGSSRALNRAHWTRMAFRNQSGLDCLPSSLRTGRREPRARQFGSQCRNSSPKRSSMIPVLVATPTQLYRRFSHS